MSTRQKKYIENLRRLFPHVPPEQIQNQEFRYMSTEEDATNTIDLMTEYCAQHDDKDPKELTIADAFACLGGNTYSFSVTFKHVMAYEKDEKRFNFLKKNVRKYPGQRTNRTVFVYKDCLAKNGILYIPRHIIFLDPPLANPKTNEVDSHVFRFAADLCNRIGKNATTKYIFLKLPLQSNHIDDFALLEKEMSVYWTDIEIHTLSRVKRGEEVPSYTIVSAYYNGISSQHTHVKNQHVSVLLAQLQQIIQTCPTCQILN
jgi:16S rRNA G966 N2-methylase RsmD